MKLLTKLFNPLFEPCDPTRLALFRIAFGFLMMLDIVIERGLEDADIRFGDPNFCFFPLLLWIRPVPVEWACFFYSVMWMGAFGICFGLFFKLSCSLYLIPYLYFFLLDKSRWNNHSYLFLLFSFLFLLSPGAGNCLSLGKESSEDRKQIPKWNYFLFKFQIFILYFFAGIKKLDSDWLTGYSMQRLARHWIFSPFTLLLTEEQISLFIIHLGGLFYDLFVGFLLISRWKWMKSLAFFLSLTFHGMNSQIFDIGMFPYVCLASLVLFLEDDAWIVKKFLSKNQPKSKTKTDNKTTENRKVTITFITFYVVIQLFLPFSHSITKGYNTWTPGIYGYSWDMMVNSWETLHQKITVRNRETGEEKFLDPDVWVTNDRWSSHADMAKQYAHCIHRNIFHNLSLGSTPIEIHFDIWKSLNGRFQQRVFHPKTNILSAPWSPFKKTPWVLPLLKKYSDFRKSHFAQTASKINGESGKRDLIFVADFPGLSLENFLPKELQNVTVVLIKGNIVVEQGKEKVSLVSGKKMATGVKAGESHTIYTLSYPEPSLYMYTYTNATKENEEIVENGESTIVLELFARSWKNLFSFFYEKVDLFSRCFYLVFNAYLKIFFDVPMVIRKSV